MNTQENKPTHDSPCLWLTLQTRTIFNDQLRRPIKFGFQFDLICLHKQNFKLADLHLDDNTNILNVQSPTSNSSFTVHNLFQCRQVGHTLIMKVTELK